MNIFVCILIFLDVLEYEYLLDTKLFNKQQHLLKNVYKDYY